MHPYPRAHRKPSQVRTCCGYIVAVALPLLSPPAGRAQYFNEAKAEQVDDSGNPSPTIEAAKFKTRSTNIRGGGSAASATTEPITDLYTDHLAVRYTRDYDLKYFDVAGMSLWRPSTPAGWSRFGDALVIKDTAQTPVLIVKDDPAFVMKPVRFDLVWGDNLANFQNSTLTIWRPVAPDGFVALGFAVNKGPGAPDANLYRCIRRDLVLPGKFERLGKATSDGNHHFQAFYVIKYAGADPVMPTNLAQYAWWDDRYRDANSPELPSVPDVTKPGGIPHRYACEAWVVKGLTADQISTDMIDGVRREYNSRLQESGAALVNHIAADQALAAQFTEVGTKITAATATAQAARSTAPASLTMPAPTPAPTRSTPATFKRSSTFAAAHRTSHNFMPVPTPIGMPNPNRPGQPGVIRDWNPGASFAAGNTSPTRALSDVPGLADVAFLKSVQLTNAVVTQGKIATGPEINQPYLIARGDVAITFAAPVGAVQGRAIILSRLFRDTGVQTGVIVLVPTERLIEVAQLNQDPVSQFGWPKTVAVMFAPNAHQWESADLPAEIATELRSVIPAGHAVPFRKDVAIRLKAALNRSGRIDTVLGSVSTEVLFTAILRGPTNEKLRLITEPVGAFKPGFLPPGLSLNAPAFEIVPIDRDLGLMALFDLDVGGVLKAELPVHLGLGSTVNLSGNLPGTWTNPLDIPSLTLSEMKFDGGLGIGAPTLSLKAKASFLGKTMNIAGGFTFGPLTLSMFSAKDVNLSLGDLIGFQHQLLHAIVPANLPEFKINVPDRLIEIRNATVDLAAQPVASMNVEQGAKVAGDLYVSGGKVGTATVHVNPGNGLQVQAATIPMSLGPISLTGSNGSGGPSLDLLYWPLKDPPYSLEQHCYFTGQARVAGAPLKALIVLDRQNASVDLHGSIAGVFEAMVTGKADAVIDNLAKLGDMSVTAKFTDNGLNALEKEVTSLVGDNKDVKLAMTLVGSVIFRIKSMSFTTSFANLNAGGNVALAVTCSILGADFTLNPTVSLTRDGYTALAKTLAQQVVTQATSFRIPWDKAWTAIDNTAKEAAEEAKKEYQEAAKAVASSIEASEHGVADVASKAEHTGRTVVKHIGKIAKKLKFW